MKHLLRMLAVAGAILLAATGLSACGGQQHPTTAASPGGPITCTVSEDTRVGIATGNTTGVYYVLGNAYAQQISDATGGKVKATAAETTASVANIQQLVAGTYQVAFSLFDTAADAVARHGAFEGKPANVAALGRLYNNATHVIVRNDSQISTIADMKGKRISTGSPNSGTEVMAKRMLTAADSIPTATSPRSDWISPRRSRASRPAPSTASSGPVGYRPPASPTCSRRPATR